MCKCANTPRVGSSLCVSDRSVKEERALRADGAIPSVKVADGNTRLRCRRRRSLWDVGDGRRVRGFWRAAMAELLAGAVVTHVHLFVVSIHLFAEGLCF